MPAADPDTAPIGALELGGLLAPLKRHDRVALAVSGGGDSLALLHLFARWRNLDASVPDAIALTVDHGLRPESGAEAKFVARVCSELRIDHAVLAWRGQKPANGLQVAAREARYGLMLQAMAERGIAALVLAHTLDDQAETFLDRLARGSGVYGLACMAALSRRDGAVLLRPLLGVSRARLRATLRADGLSWVEDPSNENPRYRRVQMRRLLPQLARVGLDAPRLAATARAMARAAESLDGWVDDLMAEHVLRHPAGPCQFALNVLRDAPREISLRLLARLLQDTAGAVYTPRLVRLEAACEALLAGEGKRTLGGCVMVRRGDTVTLYREPGRIAPEAIELDPGETGIWDNRFVISLSSDARAGIHVSALGSGGLAQHGLLAPRGWPRPAFHRAPMIHQSGRPVALPGFEVTPPANWSGQITARPVIRAAGAVIVAGASCPGPGGAAGIACRGKKDRPARGI